MSRNAARHHASSIRTAIGIAIASLLGAMLAVVGPVAVAVAFPPDLQLPFSAGQAWYVCQGYNGAPSHSGQPDLDLTTYSRRGTDGCWGGASDAAGKPILAPANGQLVNLNNGLGGVCITFDGGGSMYFGHLSSRRSTGSVRTGQQIGVVAAAGQEGNNGYAHLHLSARSGSGCGGSLVPFDDEHGARFDGAPNLTSSGARNQWAGTRLVRSAPQPGEAGATTLTAVRNKDGRLEVYGVGRNGRFYKRFQESAGGRFTDWFEWGGSTTPGSQVTSAVNKDGRIEIYVVGSDGSAYKRYQETAGGRFNDWYRWGGDFAPGTTLTAAQNQDGRLEVYGVGRDGQALKRYQQSAGGTFVDWYRWGGSFTGS